MSLKCFPISPFCENRERRYAKTDTGPDNRAASQNDYNKIHSCEKESECIVTRCGLHYANERTGHED